MDLKPFRLDIDELINEFVEGELTTLADMKEIWLSKRFSFLFEAKPSTKLGLFMQSLYSHCLGYMTSASSISHRLAGLYCLYCLHETQPFKPTFKIYLCIREVKRLKELVTDATNESIGVVRALVNEMVERNLFLYGATDLKEGSVEERVNELTNIQDARIQHASKRLFADTQIERYIHMDMGKELDVDLLKQMSTAYAMAKELAIKEAEKVIDVQNVKHIVENQVLIGDVVGKTAEDWNSQKDMFYQQTGLRELVMGSSDQQTENEQGKSRGGVPECNEEDDNACAEKDDNFGDELEQQLLSLADFE